MVIQTYLYSVQPCNHITHSLAAQFFKLLSKLFFGVSSAGNFSAVFVVSMCLSRNLAYVWFRNIMYFILIVSFHKKMFTIVLSDVF
jgi:hypothetical protein